MNLLKFKKFYFRIFINISSFFLQYATYLILFISCNIVRKISFMVMFIFKNINLNIFIKFHRFLKFIQFIWSLYFLLHDKQIYPSLCLFYKIQMLEFLLKFLSFFSYKINIFVILKNKNKILSSWDGLGCRQL